ncbi:7-dehydrocholesterol reductase [Chaetomium fimeti]|uniref:7-dehydrocholesterol reductase n=1 Tax=Chaetomium fimeti TaxID=1854472 RepID=A0AAE0HD26_9PEZI|nr:7-dehydrocholesterol reductase [Chaetomium fimeti]
MYEPKATSWTSVVVNEFVSLQLVATSPILDWFVSISYDDFDSSLSSAAKAFLSEPISFFTSRLPTVTATAVAAYLSWVVFQACLYVFVPGPLHQAPRTPGGRRLLYRLNGFSAWAVTVALAAYASYAGFVDPAVIAKHWTTTIATAMVYSFALIGIFYIKARVVPDNKGDTLLTGHFWYDLFNGGELHPRTGQLFDWKHFNASRTGGILAWTLIFFETLDGAHERFSFYNIFGFAVMMPHLWTLQTQYLATHPVRLSTPAVVLVVIGFAVGWTINHIANEQKAASRRTNGKFRIGGQEAKTVEAKYHTADGKTHRTILLCSGLWGIVRHPNYVGSITYAWASCLPCGSGHLLPYLEAILVTGICIHRCFRDEARCKAKYGEAWAEYCQHVKSRLIPGVF